MSKNKKLIAGITAGLMIAFLVGCFSARAIAATTTRLQVLLAFLDALSQPIEVSDDPEFGGLIHNIQESFDEGIAVDGTERISGTGGASFTSGTFSTTLAITGATTLGGDLTLSDGKIGATYDNATSSSDDLLDVASFTALHATTEGEDGFGISIPFIIETEDLAVTGGTSSEHSTTTAELRVVLDDTATSSTESSFQILVRPDNGYLDDLFIAYEIDSGDHIFNTDDLFVDYSTSRVGVGTTTPAATFAVHGEVFFNNSVHLGGAITATSTLTLTDDLIVDTDTLFVDNSADKVGVSSSTPSAMLSVGADTTATSTLDFAKPCFRMNVDTGGTLTELYYWPCSGTGCPDTAHAWGWATSTTSCF